MLKVNCRPNDLLLQKFTLQTKFGHRRWRRSQKLPKSRQMTPLKDPFDFIPFIFILKAPQRIALAFYSIEKLNL